MSRSTRLPGLLVLVVSMLTAAPTRAGGEDDVVVVTASGHRLAGRLVPTEPGPTVGLAVGDRVYELERRGSRIEGRDGTAVEDPAWTAFVGALAERLDHPDGTLAEAARAALGSLGRPARPYLERARDGTEDAGRRRAIQAVLDDLDRGDR